MRQKSYNFMYKSFGYKKLIFLVLFVNYSFFNLSLSCEAESSIKFAGLDEYIELFNSEIKVNKNASLDIQEKIVYVNNGKHVRGIYRDFPITYYFMNKIFRDMRSFDIVSVERDGAPEDYHIEWVHGGYRIFFGNKNIFLEPGKYVYKLKYKTNKQLGFFDKFDELYWNVNGTGWLMPIAKVTAKVILPSGINKKDINLTGYTGFDGNANKDYEASFDASGAPVFSSTKSFDEKENLSIVVNWPKGFVAAPSQFDKIMYFIQDNIFLLISLILFIIFLFFSINLYIKKRRKQIIETVIPLFYAPKKLTPADVRYIYKMGYDSKIFAAEIINMAVNGFITIKHEKSGFFGKGAYTLVKTKEFKTQEFANQDFSSQENLEKYSLLKHSYLLDLLFRNMSFFGTSFTTADSIKLDQSNSRIIQKAVEKLQKTLKLDFYEKYFLNNIGYIISGVFIASIIILAGFFTENIAHIILGVLTFGIFGLFCYLLSGYTQEGLKIKAEIDGFKLFLETTEAERLKIIGTPPTKTPELYEKYLPYAVALGVEKQWSKQFAPVFEIMKQHGNPYMPLWYIGIGGLGGFDSFDANTFAVDLSRAATDLSKDLSRSSGSSGGGSSGGGGGGGGGGSW